MIVSISRVRTYKACPRMYELKYIEKLEPVRKPEALELGSNYHKLLEDLNNGVDLSMYSDDYSKEMAMAKAYEKYIFPKFHMVSAEQWLEHPLGNGDKLIGIVDGIADDGHIVEHKSTGLDITEEYEYNLLWDEQILAYMLLTGKRKVWYTLCRKPTIRLCKNETEEAFYKRMLDWYDVDTDSKIRLLDIERTDDEVAEFEDQLMMTIEQIRHTGYYYRNTCNCNMWGRRCEYSPVCLHYDPTQEYIEFTKGE